MNHTHVMHELRPQHRPLRIVPGPNGQPLSEADLPPPDTKRWVSRRKAEVVAAVRGGLLSLEEALERYSLSEDEFKIWQKLFQAHGQAGLRTTRCKQYRELTAGAAEARG